MIADGQMPDVDGFTLARWIKQDRRLRDIPIVMLTSMGADATGRNRRLGVEAFLTKPVKHSDLFDAIVTHFRGGRARDRRTAATPKPISLTGRAAKPLRILVAEDNAANRKLVTALLQKRGHAVKAVENGRLAVAELDGRAGDRFDVVVMDLQMPEMGGLEATTAIRAHEAPSGRRLPIVALTAHAMQGDRERCLAAGMDGYLSKPIDVDELYTTVESFGRVSAGAPAAEPTAPAATPAAASVAVDPPAERPSPSCSTNLAPCAAPAATGGCSRESSRSSARGIRRPCRNCSARWRAAKARRCASPRTR